MSYLIATLGDRLQAEETYTILEKAGIPLPQIAILGKGYKSADEFGLISTTSIAKKRAISMALWLVPFGFIAGYTFNFITKLTILEGFDPLLNHIVGGIFGAIAGGMGAVFVGGGVGLSLDSEEVVPYRNRLDDGKYLVVVKDEPAISKAQSILAQLPLESLQIYQNEQ